MSEINLEALKNTMLFSLTLRRWGNRARCKDEVALQKYLELFNAPDAEVAASAEASAIQIDTSNGNGQRKRSVSASKVLIRCEALDLLNESLTSIKAKALQYAVPSFIRPGSYVIRRDNVDNVEAILEEGDKAIRQEHLPAFIRAYPDAIVSARETPVKKGGLGPLWVEKDYPSSEALRQKYAVRWQWFALTVPEGLPPEIRAREQKKLEEQFAEAGREIRDALRVMFNELIKRATERLSVNPGEKKKVFRDSLISNIEEFFATFEARNIMNDAELAALVEKAKGVMTGVEAEKLRVDEDFRSVTANRLEEITKAMEPMIEEVQERAFDFSES